MNSQKSRLANILDNFGQVIVASIVFPLLEAKLLISLMGIGVTLLIWGIAIHLERNII